ncbi:carboxypeptidase M32 [Alkaliphilus crotonatoxidans]
MNNNQLKALVEQYNGLVKRRKQFIEVLSLLQWDLLTKAPKKTMDERSETIGTIYTEVFKLTVSDELEALLGRLMEKENFEGLSETLQKAIIYDKKQMDRYKKIPPERYGAYKTLTTKAQGVWEEAREKNDFKMFQPYLEGIVAFQREFIELRGYQGDRYNDLLEDYEPGMTTEVLDQIFAYIKEKTIPLLRQIMAAKSGPHAEVVKRNYPIQGQRELCLKVLEAMGYDFNKGRLDVSTHPFTIKINSGDIRITTRYEENFLNSGLFSTIHEGGHGLYEQNIDEALLDTSLSEAASTGIHESQSRFWENILGRSKGFWNYFGPIVQNTFPQSLKNTTVEELYRAVNKIEPSFIRVEADEVTYNLHIILRYELERDLIDGVITVADLPRLWKEKMEAYLGITPPNDREGVLQDIHWADGMFGYFPTYSLGNVYAAQFTKKLKADLPNYDELVESGNFKPILAWLKENIHRHGALLEPSELVKKVTGEEINPQYFVEYIEAKYKGIYEI